MNKTAQKQFIQAATRNPETGVTIPLKDISESYLRFETLLASQNTIPFSVLKNVGTVLPTEQRLNLNDAFVITHIGLFLKKIGSATPTAVQHANAVLYPYANPSVFDGGAGDANVGGIYNATLSISVNQQTYVPAMDTFGFKRVPSAQQGTINAAIAGPVTYAQGSDERPNSLYGFVETDLITLTGSQNINISVDMPDGWSGTFAEASESNYAVLVVKGYLLQNQGTFSAR